MTISKVSRSEKTPIDIVACNLDRLEKGLTLFDSRIPTVLGDQIDILATDKNGRLVMMLIFTKPIPGQYALQQMLKIYYRWNFISDFRHDFLSEARHREINLAPKPPRVMLLFPKVPPRVWSYLKWLKDRGIRTSVFLFDDLAAGNGAGPAWRKADWPREAKPLSRAMLHRLNLDNVYMVRQEKLIWQELSRLNATLRGYDKEKTLARVRERLFGEGKEKNNDKSKN
jgi:hypothetical protein